MSFMTIALMVALISITIDINRLEQAQKGSKVEDTAEVHNFYDEDYVEPIKIEKEPINVLDNIKEISIIDSLPEEVMEKEN